MNAEKIVKKLGNLYGDRVQIKSAFHIQVLSDKGPHDIWVKKDGTMKFKRAGDQEVIAEISLKGIIKKIGSKAKTQVEKMTDMLDMALIIKTSEEATEVLGDAIFTDAGYKNGKARIAMVMVRDDEITAKCIKNVEKMQKIKNIQDVERIAIMYGLMMGTRLIVYNDNKPVCDSMNHPRVKWLPREHLKAPDKLASMRKKAVKKVVKKAVKKIVKKKKIVRRA